MDRAILLMQLLALYYFAPSHFFQPYFSLYHRSLSMDEQLLGAGNMKHFLLFLIDTWTCSVFSLCLGIQNTTAIVERANENNDK